MDWDALVPRLLDIIESRGFNAFSDRLRSAVPERSFGPLVQAVQCLVAAGDMSLVRSLLGEFLSSHKDSDKIKRRLQMLLMFETRYSAPPRAYDAAAGTEVLMADVRELLDAHSFDRAAGRILDALEMGEDPELLELLGRVYALKHTTEQQSPSDSTDELDIGLVWSETTLPSQQDHDAECTRAAAAVQAIISANTPKDPDAIEWSVAAEDSSNGDIGPLLIDDNSLPAASSENAVPARVLNAKRRSKFYQQEQEILKFILEHPACSDESLASALELPIELVNHLIKTLQPGWIEKDRLGRLTLKQPLQQPSEESDPGSSGGMEALGAVPLQQEATLTGRALASVGEPVAPKAEQTITEQGSLKASPADLALAAKLSRLSPLTRQLLRTIHDERQALSKDLARKLGLETEQVNRALHSTLSNYVTVRHSFWRLNERVIPALKLAGII